MLTTEQINQIRAKSGLPPKESVANGNYVGKYDYLKKQSMGQETIEDIRQTGSNLKETFNRTKGKIQGIADAEVRGEQGKLRSFGQAFGTVAGGISHSIGDVLMGAIKAVLPQAKEDDIKGIVADIIAKSTPVLTKIDESLGRPVGSTIEAYKNLPEKSKRDVDSLLGISELALDLTGVGLGKKAGKKAIDTGVKAGSQVLSSGKQALGKTLTTTGAIGEKTGKSLVSASFPPSAGQAKNIIAYKSGTPLLKRVELAAKGIEKAPITPSEVAIKYNLVGVSRAEIAAKAKRTANQLFENQVKPVINGINKKINPKEIFNQVKKEISKTADTSKKKSLLNALESLQDDYKNVSQLSYRKLDQIKSEMAEGLPAKVWKGQDIAGELNNVRKMFSDKARALIRKELPDNVKRIYDEYGSLLSIVEKGEKALTRGLDVGVLGLTSEAIRMAGTPITTISGKAISEIGSATKRLGQRLLK